MSWSVTHERISRFSIYNCKMTTRHARGVESTRVCVPPYGEDFEKYFPFSIYASIRSCTVLVSFFFSRIVSIFHPYLCWSSISLIFFRSCFIWAIMVQNTPLVFSSCHFVFLPECDVTSRLLFSFTTSNWYYTSAYTYMSIRMTNI